MLSRMSRVIRLVFLPTALVLSWKVFRKARIARYVSYARAERFLQFASPAIISNLRATKTTAISRGDLEKHEPNTRSELSRAGDRVRGSDNAGVRRLTLCHGEENADQNAGRDEF